jgi:RHS repeat-associated protein
MYTQTTPALRSPLSGTSSFLTRVALPAILIVTVALAVPLPGIKTASPLPAIEHGTETVVHAVSSSVGAATHAVESAYGAVAREVDRGSSKGPSILRSGLQWVVRVAKVAVAPVGGLIGLLYASPASATPSTPIDPGAVTTIKTGLSGSVSAVTVMGSDAYVTNNSSTPSSIQQVALLGGTVSSYIGSSTSGCSNSGASSTFSHVVGLTNDGTNIFVLENGGNCTASHADVREITPGTGGTFTVKTLTASIGALAATSIAYSAGTLYVSNAGTIYAITVSTGAVSTFALASSIGSSYTYYHLAVDQSDAELFVSSGTSTTNAQLYWYSLSGGGATSLSGTTGTSGVLSAFSGNLYAQAPSTLHSNVVLVSESSGGESPIAGTGDSGTQDGTSTDAWFSSITSMTNDSSNLWVIDGGALREITAGTPLSESEPSSTTVSIDPGAITTPIAATYLGQPVINGNTAYVEAGNGAELYQINLTTDSQTVLAGSGTTHSCGGTYTAAQGQPAFDGLTGTFATDGYYLYAVESCYTSGGTYYANITRTSLSGPNEGATSVVWSIYSTVAPLGLTYGSDGNLYTIYNGSLLKINPLTGTSSTAASAPSGAKALQAVGTTIYLLTTNGTSSSSLYSIPVWSSSFTLLATATSIPDGTSFVVAGRYVYVGTPSEIYQLDSANSYAVIPVAGSGVSGKGAADGTGTDAWFNGVMGIASDGTNLWINDRTDGLLEMTAGTALSQAPVTPQTVPIAPPGQTNEVATGIHSSTPVIANGVAYTTNTTDILATNLTTGATTVFAGSATQGCPGQLNPSSPAFSDLYGTLTTDGHYLYAANESIVDCPTAEIDQIVRIELTGPNPGASSVVATINIQNGYGLADVLSYGPDGNIYAMTTPPGCENTTGDGNTTAVYDVINPVTDSYSSYSPTLDIGPLASDHEFIPEGVTVSGTTVYYSIYATSSGLGCHLEGTPLAAIYEGALGSTTVSLLSTTTTTADSLSNLVVTGPYLYGTNGNTVVQDTIATGSEVIAATGITGLAGLGADPDGSSLWATGGTYLWDITEKLGPLVNGGPLLNNEVLGYGNTAEKNTHLNGQGSVDTLTGNFSETYTDANVPGRGIPLTFARTYNSANAAVPSTLGLGLGWSSTWSDSVSTDPYYTSTIDVTEADGSVTRFVCSTEGSMCASPTRVLATLKWNSDGSYTYVLKRTTTYTFYSLTSSTPGELESISDPNGYTDTLSYYGPNELHTVTDQAGRQLTFGYSTSGQLLSVTDPMGRETTYTYSGTNPLTSTMVTSTDSAINETQYTYNSANEMNQITNPDGGTLLNTYTAGQVTAQTSPNGGTTTYTYNPNQFGPGMGTTNVASPGGAITTITYVQGEATSSSQAAVGLATETTSYVYDANTNGVVEVTDPLNHSTFYSYDPYGDTLTTTDANGNLTSYTYNSFGEVLTTTVGNLGTGYTTTTNTYSADGDLLSTSTPLTGDTGASGTSATTYSYTDLSHPGDVTSVINPLGGTTTYTNYDAYGDPQTITDPDGDVTTYTYNTDGQKTSMVSPDGYASGSSPTEYTTTYGYDADGNLSTVETPNGKTTTTLYNDMGQVVSVEDRDGNTTTYSYDHDGNLLSTTYADGTSTSATYNLNDVETSSTDALGNTTVYTVNAYGQVTESVSPIGTTLYGYNADGEQTTMSNAQGTTTTSYNPVGNVASVGYSDGMTSGVTYSYNALNQVASMTDGTGTTTYTYNSLGQQTSATEGSSVTSYAHDLGGDTLSISYPLASGVPNTVNYSYDDAGRMTSLEDFFGATTHFNYDNGGNLVTQVDPDGVTVDSSYDPDGNTSSVTANVGSTNEGSFSYTYDAADQVKTEVDGGTGFPSSPSLTYSYTADQQVHSVNGNNATYASNGPITTLENGTTQLYNSASELYSSTPVGGSSTTYGYNAVGERTAATDPTGGVTNLNYDQAGDLTSFSPASDLTTLSLATYTYTGGGLLASETTGGVTNQFVWDTTGSLPLMLSDGTNAYIYGPSNTPIEQMDLATAGAQGEAASTYLVMDAQGSVREQFDSTGTLLGSVSYDTNGNSSLITGTISSPVGYTGAWTDRASGMIYLRARWYDPTTAQFVSVDPLVGSTMQPYEYAGDNPLSFADPFGLSWWNPFSWTAKEWEVGAEVGVGLALGVLAAASGIGAVIEGISVASALVAGETAVDSAGFGLGILSVLSGGAATRLDQDQCDSGNSAACVGEKLGWTGVALGAVGTFGAFGVEIGAIGTASTAAAIYLGVSTMSAMFGVTASLFDITTNIMRASGVSMSSVGTSPGTVLCR